MRYINKNKGLLIVIIISIIPLLNLLTPGLPISHDGLDHVARVASFYKSLSEGIIIPRWAGNLNWGYGHPILMFLYPLPSYISSLFHFLGFSLVDSFKLVMATSYILSGIFMYLWLESFLKDNAAILGSTLYLFAPYRFIDLYVRGALGEHVAFLFLPLVLYALSQNRFDLKDNFEKKYLSLIFISISFAGLVLSHNAISLLFTPFMIFYIIYLYFENKSINKLILNLISVVSGFLLSFFFWLPAFIEGKYTLRDVVTKGVYENSFISIKDLFYGPWSFGGTGQFSVQIGIAHLVLLIMSIIFFYKLFKKNDKHKYLYLGGILLLFVSIFLMLKPSNILYQSLTILQKLQFPWRFLSIVTFSSSLVGAIFISKIEYKNKNILIVFLILLAILPTFSYWHAKSYKIIPDSFFSTPYPGTTDTGESSPIWSVRSMDSFPRGQLELISGNADIVEIKRSSTFHEYIVNAKNQTRLKENTLYFPGWKAFDNEKLANIEFQDPKNRGLMTFNLGPGNHDLTLRFDNTKIRLISNYISALSILAILLAPLFIITITRFKDNK